MHYTDLGNRLRAAREAKGLRQEDVAQACDVTQAAVQKWEAGVAAPRGLQRTAKLAEILGLEPADIRPIPSYGGNFVVREPRPPYEGPTLVQKIREEQRTALTDCLPADLQRNVDVALDLRGTPYKFSYLSRRVVASITFLPVHHDQMAALPIRLQLYRQLLANRHYNDFPLSDRHYLVAAIPASPGAKIPRAMLQEARMLDIHLEAHDDIASVCQRIVALEGTQTDLEEVYEANKHAETDWEPEPPDF